METGTSTGGKRGKFEDRRGKKVFAKTVLICGSALIAGSVFLLGAAAGAEDEKTDLNPDETIDLVEAQTEPQNEINDDVQVVLPGAVDEQEEGDDEDGVLIHSIQEDEGTSDDQPTVQAGTSEGESGAEALDLQGESLSAQNESVGTTTQENENTLKVETCEQLLAKAQGTNNTIGIAINEIGAYEAEGYEWVELVNVSSQDVDLEGWKFVEDFKCSSDDPQPKGTKHGLNQVNFGGFILVPGGFAVIADNAEKFLQRYPQFSGLVLDSSWGSLREDGERIELLDKNGEIVEGFYYSQCKETSLERDDPKKDEWHLHLSGNSVGKPNSESVKYKQYKHTIRFSEILQNPIGADKGAEWIEIFNYGSDDIGLDGWRMSNNSSGTYQLDGDVKAGQYKYFKLISTSFGLRNSNLELTILDPKGEVVSSMNIAGTAPQGTSYDYDPCTNSWKWSRFLTPGSANRLNNVPKISIKRSKHVYEDIFADFDASKTTDGDHDKLKFKWDFGDGHMSYLKETRHKFAKKGKYLVSLTVDDGSEKIVKTMKIEVESFPRLDLVLTRLVPNPSGADRGNEIIVIKNLDNKKVNLVDYRIATGSKKSHLVNHPIYEDVIIGPGREVIITNGEICKYSLLNKKGYVALKYPDGKIADIVSYEKLNIAQDEEYVLVETVGMGGRGGN